MNRSQAAAIGPRAVEPEVLLAHEFLDGLADPRAPWAVAFESWAEAKGLSAELRRAVRVDVLRLRTWGAIRRSTRRHRP